MSTPRLPRSLVCRSRSWVSALRRLWSRRLSAPRSKKSATPSSASRSPGRTRTPLGPDRLPAALSPLGLLSLEQIAVASLRDGCLGEGFAAALAGHACGRASDPEVRAVHAEIARDESEHAELAWRIVERRLKGWRSGSGRAPRSARATAAAPGCGARSGFRLARPGRRPRRFGAVEQMQVFLRVRHQVAERLA
jgi:hypothetical protein